MSDDALSEDVESAFDLSEYVQLEIVVRLPADLSPTGEATKYGHRAILPPEAVRMARIDDVLPRELERMIRLLATSLRFK